MRSKFPLLPRKDPSIGNIRKKIVSEGGGGQRGSRPPHFEGLSVNVVQLWQASKIQQDSEEIARHRATGVDFRRFPVGFRRFSSALLTCISALVLLQLSYEGVANSSDRRSFGGCVSEIAKFRLFPGELRNF